MLKLILGVLLAATICWPPAGALGDDDVQRAIDPGRTAVRFSVQHVFVTRVTGSVPLSSGSVTLRGGSAIPLAARATIDATRIQTGDRDRDRDLRSADFFDVKTFPAWTFESTSVTPNGDAAFGMDGMLTIHGVTRPEHFDVTVSGGAEPVYHAVGHIDRHAFGMAVTRLDPAIGGIVDVTLDVVLK